MKAATITPPLPSLEIATEDTTGLLGACDVGYSCTYINTICWATPTSPLPMEINPRAVFTRLFGDGSNAAERLARIQRERSILDEVADEVKGLEYGLGAGDRNRLAEYLDGWLRAGGVRAEEIFGGLPEFSLYFGARVARVH